MREIVCGSALVAALALTVAAAQPADPIVRLDPAIDAVIGADAKLEKITDDFTPSLEGGVWDRRHNYLLFSNKAARLINKWTPDGKVSVFLDLGKIAKVDDPNVNLSSGTTFDGQGRLVYCSQGERAIIRIEPDGRRTVIVDSYQGQKFGSPNDLVYKKNGTLYFTDNPKEGPNGAYMLKDGILTLITQKLRRPNGIGLSPDEKVLYVNDSGGGGTPAVWRFDVQSDDTATNGRVLLEVTGEGRKGIPDGMKVDSKGNIWDGGPAGVWVISPEGKHIGTVLTPDQEANLAFGDVDGKSLFIMLHSSVYRLRVKVAGLVP